MNGFPEQWMARMRRTLGGAWEDYLRALERDPVKGLHINALKCAPDAVDAAVGGLSRTAFGDNYRTVREGRPTAHPYYAAGLYYMQEPSAMLPVASLGDLSGLRVLDLCAAPGGKTSQLAIKMRGEGVLVSNEIEYDRARILQENVVRMGYRNVVVTHFHPAALAAAFGGFFDVVVVDAPCSGEGMMRKEPQAAQNWSEANVRACAVRQKEILASADACLKEGGLLLYSTCTFSEEEDENVVRHALSLGYRTEEPPAEIRALGATEGAGYKFYPHRMDGEGQFFCLLRKQSEGRREERFRKRYASASGAETSAVREVADVGGRIAKKGDLLFLPALDFDLPCLTNGVFLGRMEKGRFTPAHSLFTSLGGQCRLRLDLPREDARVAQYLSGAEIAGETKGWCAVCVDGFALGGGKGSGGVIKNHYPKSLRTRG